MSFRLPQLAGTAVLAIAASALALPLAPTALAAGAPVETEYFISDTDGDASYELWSRATPAGTATKVAGDATHDVDGLSFSRDGSRLTYVQRTLNSLGAPVSTQVVVRDVSGRGVRTVASVLETAGEDSSPSLSPDGGTVTWTQVTSSGPALYKSAVGAGSATLVKAGYFASTFLDASTLLARSASTPGWASLTLTGAATATSGIDANAFDVSVSADGQHLAWAEDTSTSNVSTSDIKTATLAVSGGVASIGTAALVASGMANEAPSFSVDGSRLYFVKWDGSNGSGDIYSAPVVADGANPPAVTVATPGDEYDVAVGTTDDGTAPAGPSMLPAALNGSAATLRWALPADTDLSGVLITRKLGSTVQKSNVYVPAPTTSYVDSGLVLGSTYTYVVTTVDRSGNLGTVATRSLTALLPAPRFADPTSTTSSRAYFPVTFASTGPTSVRYYVDYLPVGTTTWRHWVVNATGRGRTFGVASSTSGVASTTSTPGTNYVFRVLMKDQAGNATAWVSSARAVVPFDQSKATLSGGSTIASSSSYLGSIRQLKTTASYARVTLTGNRLQVIGIKCAACGKFAIYQGSTKLATVDTYASSTRLRQVLFVKTYTTVASRTFTVRPLATAGRPSVDLDGFAMRR